MDAPCSQASARAEMAYGRAGYADWPAKKPIGRARCTIGSAGTPRRCARGTLAFHAFFEVYRMFEGQTQWTLLASIGKKAFEDDSIPPSTTTAVQYYIQARRGDLRSDPSDPITIRMGVLGIDTNAPAESGEENTGDTLGMAA